MIRTLLAVNVCGVLLVEYHHRVLCVAVRLPSARATWVKTGSAPAASFSVVVRLLFFLLLLLLLLLALLPDEVPASSLAVPWASWFSASSCTRRAGSASRYSFFAASTMAMSTSHMQQSDEYRVGCTRPRVKLPSSFSTNQEHTKWTPASLASLSVNAVSIIDFPFLSFRTDSWPISHFGLSLSSTKEKA